MLSLRFFLTQVNYGFSQKRLYVALPSGLASFSFMNRLGAGQVSKGVLWLRY
jgi:hypothetical protein